MVCISKFDIKLQIDDCTSVKLTVILIVFKKKVLRFLDVPSVPRYLCLIS